MSYVLPVELGIVYQHKPSCRLPMRTGISQKQQCFGIMCQFSSSYFSLQLRCRFKRRASKFIFFNVWQIKWCFCECVLNRFFNVSLTMHLGIIFVNNQLDAQFFFMYIYFYSLHVSGSHVPIIRRINCINTTCGICHSV